MAMIEFSQHGPVARLQIRRVAKKNALTTVMWQALLDHCEALDAAAALPRSPATPRVLLLQGDGGAFCAGADIEELQRLLADRPALERNFDIVARAQRALQALPLPTLAVIDGPCFGGGFGLAAACDFRIASTRSRYAITPAKLGLLYSLEDTRRVVRLLGDARARRLLLRGEQLDAATALAWGAIDAMVDPDALIAEAERWAAQLAAQSPTSMAGIKATLQAVSGHGAAAFADQARLQMMFSAAFDAGDFAEGAAAFLAGRAPAF